MEFTLANIKTKKEMEKVDIYIQMEIYTKANIKTTK